MFHEQLGRFGLWHDSSMSAGFCVNRVRLCFIEVVAMLLAPIWFSVLPMASRLRGRSSTVLPLDVKPLDLIGDIGLQQHVDIGGDRLHRRLGLSAIVQQALYFAEVIHINTTSVEPAHTSGDPADPSRR